MTDREIERARIVAWLRARASKISAAGIGSLVAISSLHNIASQIERGDHLKDFE